MQDFNDEIRLDGNQPIVAPHFTSREVLGMPKEPKLVNFLTSKKIVKSEKQAVTLILILLAVLVLGSVYMLYSMNNRTLKVDPGIIFHKFPL